MQSTQARFLVEIGTADIMKLTHEESIQKFVHSFLQNPYHFEIPTSRDNEKSMIYETIGDVLVADGQLSSALYAYTRAVEASALPFSAKIGGCLAKRALVLRKMKFYEDALEDIHRAFDTPIHETVKVQLRNTEGEIIDILAKERICDLFATISAQKEGEPVLLEGENEEIPGASKAIALAYNEEFGRHFVATMPIKAGDVLLVEKPSYVLSFHKYFNRTRVCTYCLKYCLVSVSCKHCLEEVFCSEECLEEATKKYHKFECKKLNYDDFADILIAAIRMLMIFAKEEAVRKDAIKFMNKLDKQEGQEDPRTTGFTENKFIANNIQAMLSLNCKPTSTVDRASRWHSLYVAYSAVQLRQKSDFLLNNSEVLGVAKLLYRLAFIFQENCMMIKHKEIGVGGGLYPTFSFLNHSCVPNAIMSTCKDFKKVLRACKDIKPGEQIFRSYLEGSLIRDSTKRKEYLKTSFNFSCSCEACNAHYTFKNEATEKLLLPKALQRQLRMSPINIEAMWRLLKIMQRDIKQPCVEVEIMNAALSDAYSGKLNSDLKLLYANLGVL